MSKLHPDKNDTDTTKLAQIISEAKETILKMILVNLRFDFALIRTSSKEIFSFPKYHVSSIFFPFRFYYNILSMNISHKP